MSLEFKKRTKESLNSLPPQGETIELLARDIRELSDRYCASLGAEQEPAPLSKEQLEKLLNDFLNQLIASKPVAPASMDQQPDSEGEQQSQEGKRIPSPGELSQGYRLGGEQTLQRDAEQHAGRERGRGVVPPTLKQVDDIFTVDPNMWEKMTEAEQENYLHELSMTKRTFILDGVKHVYDSNQDPVSWNPGGS